jgi:amino acid adenylation domain-containing protein
MRDSATNAQSIWNTERREMDCASNPVGTPPSLEIDKGVVDFFEHQVVRTPESIALTFGNSSVNYKELNERSNKLARYLIQTGIEPECVVALLLHRSVDMVIAILAILKSGAAYLPIDPKSPKERLDLILVDAKPALVITSQDNHHRLPNETSSLLIDSVSLLTHIGRFSVANPSSTNSRRCVPLNAAYVLYTSGSTGVPKAVIGLHQGLANRLAWFHDRFSCAATLPVLARTSPGFIDASTEVLGPLIHGQRVVLAPPESGGDPLAIATLIARHDIGMITVTPSLLIQLLTPELARLLTACKLWISSGELLPETTVRRFKDTLTGARLINLYGCSEASGDSLWNDCDHNNHSMGAAIWGTGVHVLNDVLQPAARGVIGDLYISGVGLARGYMNNAGITAERFLPDPFAGDGSRMYRTGDLAMIRPDDLLEFVGRSDHQIKVRGIRLELGEVEAVLRRYLPIADAVATSRVDRYGETQLLAYVTLARGTRILGQDLRRMLNQYVPSHIIPAVIVVIESIPYTMSGKVDKRSLPAPPSESHIILSSPSSPEEQVLCRIFADVLGLDEVSAEGNLFDLGIHSLVATRIASRLRHELRVDCSVARLLEAKTISELAEMLRSLKEATRPVIRRR